MVRMAEDLAEKLAWISNVGDTTSADYLDPLTRAAIEADYERIRSTVEKIQAAKRELQAATAPDLGNAGA